MTAQNNTGFRVMPLADQSAVEVVDGGRRATVHVGNPFGKWTLMELLAGSNGNVEIAVFEDFSVQAGQLRFVDTHGVRFEFTKSQEATADNKSKLYLGHTLDDVKNSATDLLGDEILRNPNDPDYERVAGVFPPIRRLTGSYTFLGTPQTIDKVGFAYGGRTSDFDPAPYYPPINTIRAQGKVLDGLIGGYLPVLRFVYPESASNWTEMLASAPFRISNGNERIQPVWYRIAHVEANSLKWVHYIDSYHPFPPRVSYNPKLFYGDLIALRKGWQSTLSGGMKIAIPDERLQNIVHFALIREMMTRVRDYPKYGAVDKDYAGSGTMDSRIRSRWIQAPCWRGGLLMWRAGTSITTLGNSFGTMVRFSTADRKPVNNLYGQAC